MINVCYIVRCGLNEALGIFQLSFIAESGKKFSAKRFFNLNYENLIVISHEDTTNDLTKRSGDKITSIRPNIQPKAALKLAGMVDFVARVVNDNGVRTVSFKADEVTFGGGRLNISNVEIPCTLEAILDLYDGNVTTVEKPKRQGRAAKSEETPKVEETPIAPPIAPTMDEDLPIMEITDDGLVPIPDIPFEVDTKTTTAPMETADATPTPTLRRRKVREEETK